MNPGEPQSPALPAPEQLSSAVRSKMLSDAFKDPSTFVFGTLEAWADAPMLAGDVGVC